MNSENQDNSDKKLKKKLANQKYYQKKVKSKPDFFLPKVEPTPEVKPEKLEVVKVRKQVQPVIIQDTSMKTTIMNTVLMSSIPILIPTLLRMITQIYLKPTTTTSPNVSQHSYQTSSDQESQNIQSLSQLQSFT
jgi:hypothetical protein